LTEKNAKPKPRGGRTAYLDFWRANGLLLKWTSITPDEHAAKLLLPQQELPTDGPAQALTATMHEFSAKGQKITIPFRP
jgi:hypothetical protein